MAAFTLPERVTAQRSTLANWAKLISSGNIDSLGEREILPDFLTDFFHGILGYAGPVTGSGRYTFSREKHVEVGGKYADAVIGAFSGAAAPKFLVAVEGKGPRYPLDRPFAYGLTPGDTRLMWETAPPRMPEGSTADAVGKV